MDERQKKTRPIDSRENFPTRIGPSVEVPRWGSPMELCPRLTL